MHEQRVRSVIGHLCRGFSFLIDQRLLLYVPVLSFPYRCQLDIFISSSSSSSSSTPSSTGRRRTGQEISLSNELTDDAIHHVCLSNIEDTHRHKHTERERERRGKGNIL